MQLNTEHNFIKFTKKAKWNNTKRKDYILWKDSDLIRAILGIVPIYSHVL